MKYLITFILLITGFATMAQAPANDQCTGAVTIACNGTVNGDNTNALDDAMPAASCGSSSAGVTRGVWYKITPAAGGPVKLVTCGTAWDTYLRVYTGTCNGFTACVQYDDDYCAPASELTFSATAGTTYYILLGGYDSNDFGTFSLTAECGGGCFPPSVLSATDITSNSATINWANTGIYTLEYGLAGFSPGTGATAAGGIITVNQSTSPRTIYLLQPNTTYDVYVRKECTSGVYSANSPVLRFTTEPPPPPNDDCPAAITVSTLPINTSNAGATQSESPVLCSGFTSSQARDVWFKFTAPPYPNGSGYPVTITINNSNGFDPVLQVFSGDCTNRYEIGCSDTSALNGSESITFVSNYYDSNLLVRVYGYGGGTGSFDVSVCKDWMTITSSATDFCINPTITLTGDIPGGTYQWFRNFTPVAGQNATLNITTPGTYHAIVTVGNCQLFSNELEINGDMVAPGLGGTGIYNEYESVNVGIPLTEFSQSYTWRKAGNIAVHGPLNGNGSNQSYEFSMTPADVGIYNVQSDRPGCAPVFSNNVPVYFGGITGLKLDNCPYNAVKFSWDDYQNPAKLFRYEVSEFDYTLGNYTETTNTYATVDNLQPNTQYYIHVMGASFFSLNQSSAYFSNSLVYTIPFTTQSAAPAADTEWLGTADTDWFNSANWRCNVVPGQNSTVNIPSGRPRYPVVNTNTTVRSVTVRTGATVTVNPGIIVTVKN